MSEQESKTPKFLTDLKIEPNPVIRPVSLGSPNEIVTISAQVYTGGSKVPIDFIIIHPDNEEERNIQRHLGQDSHWIANVNMKYSIHHDREPGEYYVIAKIRANCADKDDCKRKGSFKVEKNPGEA